MRFYWCFTAYLGETEEVRAGVRDRKETEGTGCVYVWLFVYLLLRGNALVCVCLEGPWSVSLCFIMVSVTVC